MEADEPAAPVAPQPPTLEKAFKLAAREAAVGLCDRLIRLAVDDEATVVFAIVREEKHSDGTLTYTQEAKVGLEDAHRQRGHRRAYS